MIAACDASVRMRRRKRPFARLSMPFEGQELICLIRIELAGRDLDDRDAWDPPGLLQFKPCECC